MRKINLIILHHSDSDVTAHDDISVIKEWHLKRGFSDVGYHYFIRKDGLIQKGRDLEVVGAHCKSKNKNSIGICLSGRSKFTHHQFKTLANIILNLRAYYDKQIPIKGHNKFSKKDCPIFSVDEFKDNWIIKK